MVSLKMLVEMARKWQQIATSRGRRFSFPTTDPKLEYQQLLADKGHFVVYTTDHGRFEVPLRFLCSGLFQEMLRLSGDRFRLSGDGPVTMPCDAASMEYLISLVRRGLAKDVENALLGTVISSHCLSTACPDSPCAPRLVLVCG